ncbi:MAG TPA: hypothetical protein VKS22_12345 [Candidatus Binataceae bacterium]|nr:hypothetical protein [Candidatus Binataceae bacterium]
MQAGTPETGIKAPLALPMATQPIIAPCSPKPYLSIRELAGFTPWSEQAIRTMMAKGIFREGEHFFHVGRRPVFKWEAVVLFIERGNERVEVCIPLRRGGFVGGSQA